MNKKLSMLLPVIATCGLLAGCGTDYYTKDSTVFVAKKRQCGIYRCRGL